MMRTTGIPLLILAVCVLASGCGMLKATFPPGYEQDENAAFLFIKGVNINFINDRSLSQTPYFSEGSAASFTMFIIKAGSYKIDYHYSDMSGDSITTYSGIINLKPKPGATYFLTADISTIRDIDYSDKAHINGSLYLFTPLDTYPPVKEAKKKLLAQH